MSQIHIVEGQTGEILDFITARNIIDDAHKKSLEDSSETYRFITFADKRFSEHLEKRNRIIIPDEDGTLREFIIFQAEKYKDSEGYKARVSSRASYHDIRKASVIYPGTFEGTAAQHAGRSLNNSGWRVGTVESNRKITLTIENHTNPYEMLKRIAREFELELRFRIEHNGNRVTGRYVDLLERVGEWRGREVEFGKDLDGIRRVEKQDIVTALLGLGPRDEDGGRIEVLVEDEEALQRWGEFDEHGNLRHLIEYYEIQSDRSEMSEAEARQYTRTALDKRIDTAVTYETTILDLEAVPGMQNKKIRFGDTVRIKDTHFNPPLYLEARVFEQIRSIKSQAKKDIKLGAFTEYTEEEVMSIFQQLRYEIQRKIDYYEMEEYTYNRETIDTKDVPGNEAKSKIDTDIGDATIESTTGSQSKADQAESDANYYTDQIVIPISESLGEIEITLADAEANIDDTLIRLDDAERDLNEAKGDIGDAIGAISNLETELESKVNAEFVQTYTDEEIRIVRQALEGQISDQIGDVNASISDLQGVADGLTNRVGDAEDLLGQHDGKFENYDVKFDDIEGTFTAHFEEMQRLEGGIEANETLITTTAQGINATISDFQADYADDKTDILSSIEANEMAIQATSEGLELRVTREEFENLEIGGRNLILDTQFLNSFNNNFWRTSIFGSTVYDESSISNGVIHVNIRATSSVRLYSPVVEIDTSQPYVYSFEIKEIEDENSLYIMGGIVDNRSGSSQLNLDRLLSYTQKLEDGFEKRVYVIPAGYLDGEGSSNTGYFAFFPSWQEDRVREYYFRKPKLEKGNKPTDWTPAPEDTQSQIDGAIDRISSTEATLDIHADAIEARVHQDELTNYVDYSTYNSREAALDVTLDGITSRVSSTETEINDLTGEVDSAQSQIASLEVNVGGITSTVSDLSSDLDSANSAISSVEQRAGSIESTVSSIETDISGLESDMSSVQTRITQLPGEIDLAVSEGISGLEIGGRNYHEDTTNEYRTVNWTSWNSYPGSSNYEIPVNPGETYTASVYYKDVDTQNQVSVGVRIFWRLVNGGRQESSNSDTSVPHGGEGRAIITRTAPSDAVGATVVLRKYQGSNTTGTAKYKEVQFEKGNKATDWSPAPEDQVNKTNVLSSINLSTEGVRIQGEHILIDGDTDFTGSISAPDATFIDLTTRNMTAINATIQNSTVTGNLNANNATFQKGRFDEATIVDATIQDATITGRMTAGEIVGVDIEGASIVQRGDAGSITLDDSGLLLEDNSGEYGIRLNTDFYGGLHGDDIYIDFTVFGQTHASIGYWYNDLFLKSVASVDIISEHGTVIRVDGNVGANALTVQGGRLYAAEKIASNNQIYSTRPATRGGIAVAPSHVDYDNDLFHVLTAHTSSGGLVLYPQRFTGADVLQIQSHNQRSDYRADLILNRNGDIISMPTRNNTVTWSGRAAVANNTGRFGFVSSSKRFKVAIENVKSNPYDILKVSPRSWYDKNNVEAYADLLNRQANGEDVSFDRIDEDIKRIPGLIAEEVEGAGLSEFATYDKDGTIDGVQYDRLWTLLIPITRDHQNDIEWLKTENQLLKNEIRILKERIA